MSETTKKTSASKTDSSSDKGAKTEKSSDKGAKTETSSDDGAKTETSSDDGAKTEKSSEKPTAPDSPASSGASDVYYGKFSNVKNPAYRGGWDDIWGNGESHKKARTRAKPVKKKSAPITLGLDFTNLPKSLRNGLAKYARDELKRQKFRLSYDKHDKAGSVDWRIEFRIDP